MLILGLCETERLGEKTNVNKSVAYLSLFAGSQ